MTCETCEVKRVGACTAHGGTGWDPRAGKHPCPEVGAVEKKNSPIIIGS